MDPYSEIKASFSREVEVIQRTLADEIRKVGAELQQIDDRVDASLTQSSKVSESLFMWMMGAFILAIFLLLAIPIKYEDQTRRLVFSSPFLLQLFTVYILTQAIIILGIGEYIEKQSLGTLIAGISGYVLGQLGRMGRDSNGPSYPQPAPVVQSNP